MCVVPQSLRVLVERLPAYIRFLEQQGYSVYRQTATRLTASQAHSLYARTQDELFSLHTPVAVLLLERRRPYAAWEAVRDQLDIVYGSPDRKTAMDDIYTFFAAADSTDEAEATQHEQQTAVASSLTAAASSDSEGVPESTLPPPPPSGPPPAHFDDEDEDAMDGAFLVAVNQPSHSPPQQQTTQPAGPAVTLDQLQPAVDAEGSAVAPPPLPTISQFQWEEMESDAVLDAQPTSASPRPSSPSDSPVAFHTAPESPQVTYDEQLDEQPHTVQQQTASETGKAAIPSADCDERVSAVSPLQRLSESKRASLDAASTDAAPSNKKPLDLLAMPARLSIKERLAALNLTQEAAQANNDTAAGQTANSNHASKATATPQSVSGCAEERRASVSMLQKQAALTALFVKASRLSLEKTPFNGTRAIVPPAAICPFASIAALALTEPLPARASHSQAAFEYTVNLPSAALLLAADNTVRGVVHHMTGDEDEWGQRFAVLHFDSLYIWHSTQQDEQPQLMICVSEPTISIAYAEGVIEVKGPAGGRHLMAAELPDIEHWYDELTRAKIQLATEDKRKTDDADGNSRRASLSSTRAAATTIRVREHTDSNAASVADSTITGSNTGSPLTLQQQMRQMRQASNAAGVSAVRHMREETGAASKQRGRGAEEGEEAGAGAEDVDHTNAASLHRTLQPPPNVPHPFSSTTTPAGSGGGAVLDDSAYLRSLLLHGALFTKYKHRRGKQRWLWCSPALDTLYWSEEKGRKVKGQLSTATVTGVADGCVGVKRKGVGLTIVAEDRTVDLEARDEEQQRDWLRAIGLLVDLNRQTAARG